MSLLQYSRQERITGQPQKPPEACLQRQYAPPKDPICRQFAQVFESDDGVGCVPCVRRVNTLNPTYTTCTCIFCKFILAAIWSPLSCGN